MYTTHIENLHDIHASLGKEAVVFWPRNEGQIPPG